MMYSKKCLVENSFYRCKLKQKIGASFETPNSYLISSLDLVLSNCANFQLRQNDGKISSQMLIILRTYVL